MAYAAVVSLLETLNQLLHNSDNPSIQYIKPGVESFLEKLKSLQESLSKVYAVQTTEMQSVGELENQIQDAAYKAQDTIESYISKQFLSSESQENQPVLQELRKLSEQMLSFSESAKVTAATIKQHPEVAPRPAKKSAFFNRNDIVGQEEDFKEIKGQVDANSSKLEVIPITGMAGIGKTTLARSIYEDPDVKKKFDIRSWVTVPSDYTLGDIFSKLLDSIETPNVQHSATSDIMKDRKSPKELGIQLHQKLYNQKYLIVIDDMWDKSVWNEVRECFKDNQKGSRIILTTRDVEIAKYAKTGSGAPLKMHSTDSL